MSQNQLVNQKPKDWLAGFKQNLSSDLTSGFIVFLLALPLSLGIASASEFPPIMGVLSAIIGGILATFLTGSHLAIKGPAAGLIVIVAGAVSEFGGGVGGWKLTLGVMVVAGIIQILFGLFKLGKLVDIFPLAAVHGMLAAIGLIIIAKQIPVLLNVDPSLMQGKGPIGLFAAIPDFFVNLDPQVSIIGGISLAIMMGWKLVKNKYLKKIPAPLLVLLFSIPAGIYLGLDQNAPSYTLLKVGNIADLVGWNVDFSGLSQVSIFIKYVVMVALVGSLESLLTVKAIDLLDPHKRKSDPNKDMIAIGVANTFAAVLGGLPMISEVARSSANVSQGGQTRWANFWHGLFLLVFALFAYPLLEMIPNAALAAMLIAVGINLAHPKEFIHTYKIGSEQLAVFLTTIFFTLFEDLLVGIAAGMVLKMVIHVFRGASWRGLFKAAIEVNQHGEAYHIHLHDAAVFTNYLGIKTKLDAIPAGKEVHIHFKDAQLVDHSVMENLHHFNEDYSAKGGIVFWDEMETMEATSTHPLAAHKGISLEEELENQPVWNGSYDEKQLMHDLRHYLPAQAALKDFVHHNSLHAYQDKEFFEAIFSASKTLGIQVTFNLNEYRKLYYQGRISERILDRIIIENKGLDQLGPWLHKMLEHSFNHSYAPRIGSLRSQWKKKYQINLDDRIHPKLFRIIGAYLDQGIAIDHFPHTEEGLIQAIRQLEKQSFISFFKSKRVKKLLHDPELSLEKLLGILVGNESFFEQYVLDQQFAHPGWSGIIAAIERTPDTLLYQKSIDLRDFILLELLLEVDYLDTLFKANWKGIALDYEEEPQQYFSSVEIGSLEEVLKLWHIAFEWQYYDEVLSGLQSLQASPAPERKSFQMIFCVDDREDSIRRHLEYVDPNCETIGAPGFFGVPIYYQAFGSQFWEKHCPVPITPKHLIKETNRKNFRKKEHIQGHHTHTVLRGFFGSLSLGVWASFRFVADLINPSLRPDVADSFSLMDTHGDLQVEAHNPPAMESGLQIGFTVEEMVDLVERFLQDHDLTHDLADIVYVIGHGSTTANNPHFTAYGCGACCGRPGAVNARVFAYMANHPEVRKILSERGIELEDNIHFLGGMHDTSSDEIRYYDRSKMSDFHYQKHLKNLENIERALDLNAMERSRRFASIDTSLPVEVIRKKIKKRAVSYFEPRPELNHGSNALCFIGTRGRVSKLFLDRRAFHQSYNYEQDPDGQILKNVLGPLPTVCGGINLEYFFSRMDNEKMGAGSKLPHHVNGLIGVTNSADGDLRPGLHLQTVENHDPVRLLMIIEQEPSVILKVLEESPSNYDWFDKGWIHLVAISPLNNQLYRFSEGKFSLYEPLSSAQKSDNILETIANGQEMETNHILDATKENLPVHIYN